MLPSRRRRRATPVEKSRKGAFDFAYRDAFGAHIERFNYAFDKALVSYNADGPVGDARHWETAADQPAAAYLWAIAVCTDAVAAGVAGPGRAAGTD